ncbi:UDP-N-acetylmuramoyl-tripeptide--D-alanyl-D-alanine ligase [Wenyingzhuangia marina]|uniref:UDP-N-acetylmuramoyl-tripeptide--D-alanyl-D-alanine ligase n=1 Tax=Wenyingzhuangia marina TaxID=1195760 RepID=A0A1M5W1T0_9FLAO|nr:UDP-N-acetylmuramoyl-tripeptide--D-alanyl-D-alanine ligase [Wenyingzhuangia marina]GGF76611.1 UDP-N-acetylmuramoyl-tripeptide--D-alanyl-D-alanine ligase [Wenyingzhuangia marina]SHH81174.1 UDP-N-acetylmuramoyl-tripeptide--D-alanyl-D-alanine ligase [Wenyingzhuangia marina]
MKTADLHQLFLNQKQNFTTDTRKITQGAIFFALKGDNFNGNTFAKTALENGAAYVVIDEEAFYIDERTILVKNVLETLQHLAHFHREYLGIPIIALTGSNGKTTTKELIREVLATQYKVNATVGNLNNHIGVPLTLLNMTPETEMGVVEMGANHLKEIQYLCFIAAPNFGYITNFGKAHLEGFGSEEGIIQGKSEMYDYIANAEGKAFVNQEEKRMVEQAEYCECIYINPHETPLLELTPYVQLAHKGDVIQSNLIGKYNYNNIIAAIAIGHYFNISDNNIKKAIENYKPENNRSQIIKRGNTHIILDAYNANPTSMSAALENMNALNKSRKAVILGDMFELGTTSNEEHKNIVSKALESNFGTSIFVGQNFYQQKNNKAFFFASFDDLKNNFDFDFSNTTLLIKGSRGMALERVLDIL